MCDTVRLKIYMDSSPCFSAIFTKGNNFSGFPFVSLEMIPFKLGSTLKGKNLLLEDQMLSRNLWRREAEMQMIELPSLKVKYLA